MIKHVGKGSSFEAVLWLMSYLKKEEKLGH
jgi:hypothetical protein